MQQQLIILTGATGDLGGRIGPEILKRGGLVRALVRPGGIPTMNALIRVTRFFVPGKTEIFPPWQGMQYMRDMYNGLAKLPALDNDRYLDVNWETVAEVLRRR